MTFIILDRDGVINYDSTEYIKSPEEWIAIPGSLEAIAQLNRHGFRVVIATNQSGVARGYYSVETLDQIHEKLQTELAAVGGHIEEFFFCPHHPEEGCHCRKPRPGLLYQIRDKYHLDLENTFFIGDSHTDVQAAITSGCKPILVKTGNGEKAIADYPFIQNIPQFENLSETVQHLIHQRQTREYI